MTPSEMLRLQREKAATSPRKPKLISRSKVPFPDGFRAYIEVTHEFIKGGSYIQLREVFDRLIKSKKLNIPDPIAYLDDAICEGIKRVRGNSHGYCSSPVVGPPAQQLINKYHGDQRGPKNLRRGQHGKDAFHWKALHLAALDGRMTRDFMDTFTRVIGCGTCKASWRTILRNSPPAYSPADAFSWSVDAHNRVNQKLKPPKPSVTVEDARRIWSAT